MGSLKNPFLGGRSLQKINIEGRNYLKGGGTETVCRFKGARGGAWQEREGDAFEGEGWYHNTHYAIIPW